MALVHQEQNHWYIRNDLLVHQERFSPESRLPPSFLAPFNEITEYFVLFFNATQPTRQWITPRAAAKEFATLTSFSKPIGGQAPQTPRAFATLARQGQAATRRATRGLDGRSATAVWSPRPNGVNPFGLWLERLLQPRSQSAEEDS